MRVLAFDFRASARAGLSNLGTVVLVALVGLAGATTYFYQTNQKQAAELATLRQQGQELQQLKEETKDIQKLRAQVAEADRLRRDNEELSRLRNETRELRQTKQQFEKLQVETQQLRATVQQLQQANIENQRLRAQNEQYQQQATAAQAGAQANLANAQRNACIANLRQMDGATQQWALEQKLNAYTRVDPNAIRLYLRGQQLLQCPAGGTYSFGAVRDHPKCSVPGHGLQ